MSRSISQDFIAHVRNILVMCINEVINGKVVRQGINGWSRHALPAYICAVASIEGFINETLLGPMSKSFTQDSPLWNLSEEWVNRLEISQKVILVPQLLFNNSLHKDRQPYQDMALLIRVRNGLVHYKIGMSAPKYIRALDERGIALRGQSGTDIKADFDWLDKLSCTEGVRWAHNTACQTVRELNLIAYK